MILDFAILWLRFDYRSLQTKGKNKQRIWWQHGLDIAWFTSLSYLLPFKPNLFMVPEQNLPLKWENCMDPTSNQPSTPSSTYVKYYAVCKHIFLDETVPTTIFTKHWDTIIQKTINQTLPPSARFFDPSILSTNIQFATSQCNHKHKNDLVYYQNHYV